MLSPTCYYCHVFKISRLTPQKKTISFLKPCFARFWSIQINLWPKIMRGYFLQWWSISWDTALGSVKTYKGCLTYRISMRETDDSIWLMEKFTHHGLPLSLTYLSTRCYQWHIILVWDTWDLSHVSPWLSPQVRRRSLQTPLLMKDVLIRYASQIRPKVS